MKKVGIVMGSDSDLPVIRKATDQLKPWKYPLRYTSIPRTARRRKRVGLRWRRETPDSAY